MDMNIIPSLRFVPLVATILLLSLSTADAQQSRNTTNTSTSAARPVATESTSRNGGTTLLNCLSVTAKGYDPTRLDSLMPLYRPGHGDATCVFPVDQGMAYDEAWMGFVSGLLEVVPFPENPASLELGFYAFFAADGQLEHLFYSIPGSEKPEVAAAIESYSRQYRFPMQAPDRFKQCSSISLGGTMEMQQ